MTYILLVGGFGLAIVALGLHRLNRPQCRSHIWTMTTNPESRTSGDVELTDELLERLAGEAEEGYPVEQIRPRSRTYMRATHHARRPPPTRCMVCRRYLVPTWKRWWSTARRRTQLAWLRWHWRR